MREIKFRAWDRSINEMIFDFGSLERSKTPELNSDGLLIHYCWHTLMQFTGLQDKNGKDIYEGDVLDGHADGPGTVVYNEAMASFEYAFDEDNAIGLYEATHFLIVGNIYQK